MICIHDIPAELCEGCGSCPDYSYWMDWIYHAYPWYFGQYSDAPYIGDIIIVEEIE